jgi:hypothetical protein
VTQGYALRAKAGLFIVYSSSFILTKAALRPWLALAGQSAAAQRRATSVAQGPTVQGARRTAAPNTVRGSAQKKYKSSRKKLDTCGNTQIKLGINDSYPKSFTQNELFDSNCRFIYHAGICITS